MQLSCGNDEVNSLQSDSRHEAASAYVDSANCYKKISPKRMCSILATLDAEYLNLLFNKMENRKCCLCIYV